MFRLLRRFASHPAKTPLEAALRSLGRRQFIRSERQLDALLREAVEPRERAFLLNKRGVARIGMGRRDDARADWESAVLAAAEYAPALTNLGNLLLEEGKVDEAIRHYERAISSDPSYALAHMHLGTAYKRTGRLADAVRERRRGRELEVAAQARKTKRR
jgi:tetratricopeptide (TPR) repeat protein